MNTVVLADLGPYGMPFLIGIVLRVVGSLVLAAMGLWKLAAGKDPNVRFNGIFMIIGGVIFLVIMPYATIFLYRVWAQ